MNRTRNAPSGAPAPERTTLPLGPEAAPSPTWGTELQRHALPLGEINPGPALPFLAPLDREERREIPPPPASGVRTKPREPPAPRPPPAARVQPVRHRAWTYAALAAAALAVYVGALLGLTAGRTAPARVEVVRPSAPIVPEATLPGRPETPPASAASLAPIAPTVASVAPARGIQRPKAPRPMPSAAPTPRRPPLAFSPDP